MKTLETLAPYVGGALIGSLMLYGVAWPETIVPYPEVIVPARVIIEREPPARPPTIVERIRFVNVAPIQIARAPQGAAAEVAAFCRPSVLAVTDTVVDTVAVEDQVLLRSIVHRPGWFLQRDGLELIGPTALGDLKDFRFNVRPGFSARASGDTVIVRYPRSALVREGVEFAAVAFLAWQLRGLLGG